jgi:AP-1 complex subunit sigma 1/2
MVVDPDYNELLALEIIQFIVEILDRYFNNVCELDIIFNFHKVYFLLDEMIMSGQILETSKAAILRQVQRIETLMEGNKDGTKVS